VFADLYNATNPFTGTLDGDMYTISGLSHALFNKINGGTVRYILGLAGSNAIVRVKNLEAYCSCDPTYHNYVLNKELFSNERALKDIAKELKRGADVIVAKEVKTSDGCHTYSHYENIDEASVEFRKFIKGYSAK
jgi:hypothetical protein